MIQGANHQDGINGLVPREQMTEAARKLRDTYDIVPGAPLYKKEFGFYCIERWQEVDGLSTDADFKELFDYDDEASFKLGQLGWCEAAFFPAFEEKVLEDRGEYEVVQDYAGRAVLCFKGRRSGFMPEYLDHPVKDWKTWEENVKWRMDPSTPERFEAIKNRVPKAIEAAKEGQMIVQGLIGGYMYLRSLIGPEQLLYMFYDQPDLILDCTKTWFALADRIIEEHQKHVTIDEIFFAEDICYNHGPLISPDMIREFILPFYAQLIHNLKARQIDQGRKLFVQIDTDGFADPVIPIYREIGMNVMSPFEVASGCDVVRTARENPDLVISGGIDKRVLAQGPRAIDEMLERVIPPLRERGGFIPTCDHGVPAEVSLANYQYYRKRIVELGG